MMTMIAPPGSAVCWVYRVCPAQVGVPHPETGAIQLWRVVFHQVTHPGAVRRQRGP